MGTLARTRPLLGSKQTCSHRRCKCAAAPPAVDAPKKQQASQKGKASNKADAQKITTKSEDYNRYIMK